MENFTKNFQEFCCVYKVINRLSENYDATELNQSTGICFIENGFDYFPKVIRYIKMDSSKYRLEDCDIAGTCDEGVEPVNVVYIVFWVLLLLLIVGSNLLVIITVKKVFYLKQNITKYFITSLAVSDLLAGVSIIPIKIHFAYHNLHFCADQTICSVYATTDIIFFSISITNIFVITIDRYVALTKTYKYPTLMTSHRCKVLIAMVWIYGFAWGLLGNLKWDDISKRSSHISDYQCMSNQNFFYILLIFSLVFYIPVAIMGVLYFRIFTIARYHARSISRNNGSLVSNNNDENDGHSTTSSLDVSRWSPEVGRLSHSGHSTKIHDRLQLRSTSKSHQVIQYRRLLFKAVKTIATVYGTFILCWFPVSILSLISLSCSECFSNTNKWSTIVFVDILPILNCALNPFIYVIINKQYRKVFSEILQRFFIYKVKSPKMESAVAMPTITHL